MKTSKFLVVAAVMLAMTANNIALSKSVSEASPKFSVAVVDIQKVVENSPQINDLKVDRKAKLDSLIDFIQKAKASLDKETDEAKKKSMEAGFNKELNAKKEAIDKDYSKKLSDIDKNITGLIKSKAEASKFDLVLTKNSVVEGGTDITSEILKSLK